MLDQLGDMAPREMRRALMTGFGNAQLARRDGILLIDLPKTALKKGALGFMQ